MQETPEKPNILQDFFRILFPQLSFAFPSLLAIDTHPDLAHGSARALLLISGAQE